MRPAGLSLRRAIAWTLALDLFLGPFLARRLSPSDEMDPFVLLSRGPYGVAIAIAGIVAVLLFARPRGNPLFALFALAATGVLHEGAGRGAGIFFEPAHVGGTVTVGWLVGHAFARWVRADPARFELRGASAGIAAVYVSAGLSKLLASGFAWGFDPVVVRAMVAAHDPVGAGAWLAPVSRAVVASPALGVAMAFGALAVELGSFTLVLSDRTRRIASALLLTFHLALYLLTGILFVEGALLLLVIGGWLEPLAVRIRARRAWAGAGIAIVIAAVGWGASRAMVGQLPGPAMLGLIGAQLASEGLGAPLDEDERDAALDVRRVGLALALVLGIATAIWVIHPTPRGHRLDDAVSRQKATFG
ncbi:MAG: hypothetical protein AB7S26_37345 [Sandaracinaceae bacterium]